jgi:hypothetical protein
VLLYILNVECVGGNARTTLKYINQMCKDIQMQITCSNISDECFLILYYEIKLVRGREDLFHKKGKNLLSLAYNGLLGVKRAKERRGDDPCAGYFKMPSTETSRNTKVEMSVSELRISGT